MVQRYESSADEILLIIKGQNNGTGDAVEKKADDHEEKQGGTLHKGKDAAHDIGAKGTEKEDEVKDHSDNPPLDAA